MATPALSLSGPEGTSEVSNPQVLDESRQKDPTVAVKKTNKKCAQQDYCVGDIVYTHSDPLYRGTIVNVIRDGRDALVKFDESGNILSWSIDRLANTSHRGCVHEDEYCVGDFVYNNKEPTKRGQIVGIYGSNEELAIQYSEDSIWNWPPEKLAITRGCANDERFCVGGRVRANKASGNHRYGTIVGIYFSGETVAIAFESGVWQWNTSKLTPLE